VAALTEEGQEGVMASLLKQEKLSGALGILCFLLLSYPLLHIFNCDTFLAGVPIPFLYIFGVWVLAIICLYVMSSQFASPGPAGKQEPEGHDQ
jgi:hypothetical protein